MKHSEHDMQLSSLNVICKQCGREVLMRTDCDAIQAKDCPNYKASQKDIKK